MSRLDILSRTKADAGRRFGALFAGAFLLGSTIPPGQIEVDQNSAEIHFPDSVRFVLSASSNAPIDHIELEFWDSGMTCRPSTSRAEPRDFTSGQTISTSWTWDLRRTGPIPPGTTIHWQWRIRDQVGNETLTPEQTIVFADPSHAWRTSESRSLRLSWYQGDSGFAQELLASGEDSLARLQRDTGVVLATRVDLFLYANADEMQAATLFAPGWSGGLAFPSYRTILAAIGPTDVEWGKDAVAHELSHVVIGAFTFSCVNSMPTWVDEGLATFAEGELEPYLADLLDTAIRENRLYSVAALGEIFSADPDQARLAYAQSFSLAGFLLDRYGPEAMLRLLTAFRGGATEDAALGEAYGFDRRGLEQAWRASVGAPPLVETPGAERTATRTPYPTFALSGGPPLSVTESRGGAATAEATVPVPEETPPAPEGTVDSCLVAVLGLALLGMTSVGTIYIVRRRAQRGR